MWNEDRQAINIRVEVRPEKCDVNSIQGELRARNYGLRFSNDIIEQVRKYSQLISKRLIKAGLNVYDISETETETLLLGLLVTDVPTRR